MRFSVEQKNGVRRILSLFLAFTVLFSSLANATPTNPPPPGSDPAKVEPATGAKVVGEGEFAGTEDISEQLTREGKNLPEAKSAEQELELLLSQIDSAGETDFPQKTPDAFNLARQKLTITTQRKGSAPEQKSYDLSRLNVTLPAVATGDFDKDVLVVIDRQAKTLSLVKMKDGVEQARQTIPNLDVISYARSKESMQFITYDGLVHVIDMAFARSRYVLFKTPIPVFTVGKLPNSAIADIENMKIGFVTRGLKLPNRMNKDAFIPVIDQELFDATGQANMRAQWNAGPAIVYKDNSPNDRELFRIYHRDVTNEQVKFGWAVLHSLAYAISPEGQSDATAILMRDQQVAQVSTAAETRLDTQSREALSAFTPEVTSQVQTRIRALSQGIGPTDKFMYEEAAQAFSQFAAKASQPAAPAPGGIIGKIKSFFNPNGRAEAAQEAADLANGVAAGDLGAQWQQLTDARVDESQKEQKNMFRRLVSNGGLRKIAYLTLGFGALDAAHQGAISVEQGNGPAWANHFAQSVYKVLPVLSDSAYRVTMFKGILVLGSLPFIHQAIGLFMARNDGWDFRKHLAKGGARIAAQLQFSFIARLAQLARQKTFITALRTGVNPFKTIRASSLSGQMAGLNEDVRPGVLNPFNNRNTMQTQVEQRNAVLEAKVKVARRQRAMAALVADMMLAEKFGIDPATVARAVKGDLTEEQVLQTAAEVKRIRSNPVFLKAHQKMQREVYYALEGMHAFKNDVANIPIEQIMGFYSTGRRAVQKLTGNGRLNAALGDLKNSWKDFVRGKAFKAVGNFGYGEYQFLSTVEPTKFVGEQSWSQFSADFWFSILEIPLVTERADLSRPHELAHSEHHFGYTTPGHWSDMGNQDIIYGVMVPAQIAQVYGDKAVEVRDERFQPLEWITLKSVTKPEAFLKGIWTWAKGAANVRRGNYGFIYTKDAIKKLKAIQMSFIMDFSCRILLAKQSAVAAVPAFIYSRLMGTWAYAWPWPIITRGNQVYEEQMDERNAELRAFQTGLSQGMRFSNETERDIAFNGLLNLYRKHSKLDSEFADMLNKIEAVIDVPAQQRIDAERAIKQSIGSVLRLKIAIERKDQPAIRRAYDELSRLQANNIPADANLNAQELLEFSVTNPPFKNSVNSAVPTLTNVIGAAVTTYLGTNMFVDLLRDHSWSEKIMSGVAISIPLYVSLFYAQKGLNNFATTLEYIRVRDLVPQKAFADAQAQIPKFKSLVEYAAWLKTQSSTSEVLRAETPEAIAQVIRQNSILVRGGEAAILAEINKGQRPTLNQIRSCGFELLGEQVTPMTRIEKIITAIKGTIRPPIAN